MSTAFGGAQESLWRVAPEHVGGVENLAATFRRLYYHLYSNSNASRAERIIDDLSLLLLLKLAAESKPEESPIGDYLAKKKGAEKLLLPFIKASFPNLIAKHHKFHLGDAALSLALEELCAVDLSKAPAHVLGEAFQALIGPQLRGEKGQFFTPHSLVTAMVQILDPQPGESVLDPACGTGGFLVEAHAYQARLAGDRQFSGALVGTDKDTDLARLACALVRVATGDRGHVADADSLRDQVLSRDDSQYDVVLTNPPFGSRIGVKDPDTLRQYSFGHQWIRGDDDRWRESDALVASQDPQILFLELCIEKLKPGGRMGIVLPEGLFGNRSQSYIWEWVRSKGTITALLDCPRTTFQPSTDIKTNVLFFEKATQTPGRRKTAPTRIGVALQCGHDRRGRTHLPDGTPFPDDLKRLSASYGARGRGKDGWISADLGSREYIVPRYFVEEEPASAEERSLVAGAPIATLQDLVDNGAISVRKGNEVGGAAYGTGSVPFVRTSDLANFEIRTDPTKAVSEDIYEDFREQQDLRPGDILMVVDGRYRIGTTAILTKNNYHCVAQSHLRIIKVERPEVVEPYELLYALDLPSVKLRIRDLVFVQSTLGTLGKRLFELRIPLLHGNGPWRSRVDHFQKVLEQRDALLAELGSTGRDFEL